MMQKLHVEKSKMFLSLNILGHPSLSRSHTLLPNYTLHENPHRPVIKNYHNFNLE